MSSIIQRCRTLTRKLTASPTLPLLGWTKAVESVVAAGPTLRWLGYAALVTVVWVAGDALQRRADDVVDEATDAVEEATDS
jgi:hypothetical protein